MALQSVLLCGDLNQKSFGSASYTIKQLIKYGPKPVNHMVLKEIYTCILLILDSHGFEQTQLEELRNFCIFGCSHKAVEVRNESMLVVKMLYTVFGKEIEISSKVLNQEQEATELLDRLQMLLNPKVEMGDEMLASPEKPAETKDQEEDYFITPVKSTPVEDNEEEKEIPQFKEPIHSPTPPRKASDKSDSIRKSSRISVNQPRRSSNFAKLKPQEEAKVFLEIKDYGNKEMRDKKDAKGLWSPGEVRTDVVQKIREQIKAAFGSKVEQE